LLFAFLGLLYNLNWLSSVLFSTRLRIIYTHSTLKFRVFLPLALVLMAMLPFTSLFCML
jgi:hypothetical protein